ncbi:MAG: flagellar assembly protein FliW [Candidatus Muiribacteriota bacterium]
MQLNTSRFGTLEINENDVYFFKYGVFGFENYKKFVFLNEEESMFSWLQSVDNPDLAFVIIRPIDFYYNYILDLDLPDANDLMIDDNSETEIFCIVVIPEDTSMMTGNLQGPIILNKSRMLGKQVISLNPEHKLKHFILDELKRKVELEKGDKAGEDNR